MELKDVRVGNYVTEHEFSSRGRGLYEGFYRVEYQDLGNFNSFKFDLILPLNLMINSLLLL